MKICGFITMLVSVVMGSPLGAIAADGIAKPWQLGFQTPASPVMEQLYAGHNYLVILITVISVFVLALLLYVCLRFRASANPNPSKTTHNTTVEILWTVIPIIILVAIAIPSLRLHYFMNDATTDADMTLKVIGYQWYWNYEYPEHDLSFDSNIKQDDELLPGEPRLLAVDNPIVVPVNKKIRILTTGGDVIHAFAVPAFGVKQDTVPGRLNETWFTATREGTFYGQCSELCGRLHGFMPIQVEVVSEAFFERWAETAKEDIEAASQLVAELRGRSPRAIAADKQE